jgi:hypothetical protein
MTTAIAALAVGTRVRIERDEVRYPSRTWPQFRGRTGTVVEINEDRKRPHLTEYGVILGSPGLVSKRRDGRGAFTWNGRSTVVTWFKLYELTCIGVWEGSQRAHGSGYGTTGIGDTGERLSIEETAA